MPRVGAAERLWMNGLYDALCIIVVFPAIVYLGAGGVIHGKFASRLCTFLGDLSYPLYITHFPLIYVYTAWVSRHKATFQEAVPVALLTFIASIVIGYACLKWYDIPVRKWLQRV